MRDLDAIKSLYDMRRILPASPKRRKHGLDGRYESDLCLWHSDHKPSLLIFQDGFICRACGKRGDIFTWTMEQAGVSLKESIVLLGGSEHIDFLPPPAPIPIINEPVRTVVYKPGDEMLFVNDMSDAVYGIFKTKTGIEKQTAEDHLVGVLDSASDDLFTIPIHDPEGTLVDIKVYRPRAPVGTLKMYHLRKGAHNTVYGYHYLNGDGYAVIVGGEKDAMRGHQDRLPFITVTGGENSWREEFNRYLDTRAKLYAWNDADPTGRKATEKICRAARRVIPCDWKLLWDSNVPRGFDYSDFRDQGGTIENFLTMLRMAEKGLTGHRPLKETLNG